MYGDRENCGALTVRGVGRRGAVLVGGRWRVAIALRLPVFLRLRPSIFRRGESGATVAATRGARSAEARDRYRRKQDQKQQSETDSHDFRLHKTLSMAPRGGGAPTYLSARRNGTFAGESCAEPRLVIGGDGGLYSFEHFCVRAGLALFASATCAKWNRRRP
jgi:hypothetical protein